MPGTTPPTEPGRREWTGFWAMIVQQTQNAFNDKVAQFTLIPLGAAVGVGVESLAGLLIALPFVLFAPVAGWMSDRFSKRDVMFGAAVAQLLILVWICVAVHLRDIWLGMFGFFLLAAQSAFYSPAKIGSNKELLGSERLGFAAGIQQMTTLLGILAGQIAAGWVFDHRFSGMGGTADAAWQAALAPLWVLTALAVPALVLAWIIPRVPPAGGQPLRAAVLVEHFSHLRELWRDAPLRRASLGVAFFWGFAGFLNLWSVKVAKAMTGGQEGFGSVSSAFMAAASLGMVVGFGLASFLMRRRVELGWVPVAGVLMAVLGVALALAPPAGWTFLVLLGLLAVVSALFLTPLNALLQDRYPAEKRGELQSAVNLQDCLGGMLAVGTVVLLEYVAGWLHMEPLAGIQAQAWVMAAGCAVAAVFSLRLMPAGFIRVLGLGLVASMYRVRRVHLERVPERGGVLLLPNHVTWVDAFYLSAACPRPVRFVMEEAFMRHGAIRWFVTLFETVTIRRDKPREAIRTVLRALRNDEVVCLFPEGQLTRTGALSRLQRGFGLIASQTDRPLVPVWCDGLWGTGLSHVRGRFRGTWRDVVGRPELIALYGPPLAPGSGVAELHQAMLELCAEAVAVRFRSAAWQAKVPPAGGGAWARMSPEERRQAWINGYQTGQLTALPRKRAFHVLADEHRDGLLPPALSAFATLFASPMMPGSQPAGGVWVGSDALRRWFEDHAPAAMVTFCDFSSRALEPLQQANVRHLPCLAVDGRVVAMATPEPPDVPGVKDPQRGARPGSWGKLLPGWFPRAGEAGRMRLHGPAAAPPGLALPRPAVLDDDGFLLPTESAGAEPP